MVYKRYASPFEETPKKEIYRQKTEADKSYIPPPPQQKNKQNVSNTFLNKMATDDILLIALIIILLSEDKENRDVPMILTLAFLFLIQYIDAD